LIVQNSIPNYLCFPDLNIRVDPTLSFWWDWVRTRQRFSVWSWLAFFSAQPEFRSTSPDDSKRRRKDSDFRAWMSQHILQGSMSSQFSCFAPEIFYFWNILFFYLLLTENFEESFNILLHVRFYPKWNTQCQGNLYTLLTQPNLAYHIRFGYGPSNQHVNWKYSILFDHVFKLQISLEFDIS
jgi:hypothetical protein